jgi:hypothetical protein
MIHAACAEKPAGEIPLDIIFTTKGKGPFRGPLPERTGYPGGAAPTAPEGDHRSDYIPDFGIRLMNFFSVIALCTSCMRAFTWPLSPFAEFSDILNFSC